MSCKKEGDSVSRELNLLSSKILHSSVLLEKEVGSVPSEFRRPKAEDCLNGEPHLLASKILHSSVLSKEEVGSVPSEFRRPPGRGLFERGTLPTSSACDKNECRSVSLYR